MDLLIYIAKASLVLTLFWVVYKVFLENETFHRVKRIYLHLGYILSLILPLLSVTKIKEISVSPSYLMPTSSADFVSVEPEVSTLEMLWTFITDFRLIEVLYISVALVFSIHFILKFFKLLKFLRTSKAMMVNDHKLIEQPIAEGAFSFLNYIVYDPSLYSEEELKIILAHEKAHVSNKHSIDILFSHIYNCIFWINPFAWLYQKSLVLNLEYEADSKVVNNTTKKDYQLTLYSITQQQYKSQLQHSFHQSPIKKRIAMLNQNKTQSFWKLFIVSPLLLVFFLLFQVETKAQIKESKMTSETKVNRIEVTFDENTTKEDLESTVDFLKEDFNIDMSYSNLELKPNGVLRAITLEVDCNDGFSGSVTSPDVSKLPVYFYRDFTEGVESPFGVGTKSNKEVMSLPDSGSLKNVETLIINEKKIDKEKLLNKYIPVKRYTHMKSSNTLYINTRSEFPKPYYSGMFEAKEELNNIFEADESEGVIYFKVGKDNITVMTINNFKISDSAENASQYNISNDQYRSALNKHSSDIFIVDGVEVDQKTLYKMKPDQIKSMTVVKSPSELKKAGYDSKEVNGLIKITTKSNNLNESKFTYNEIDNLLNDNYESAIYLVNGKEVKREKASQVKFDQIDSVFIENSTDKIKKAGYDPKKVERIIMISTKDNNSEKAIKIK